MAHLTEQRVADQANSLLRRSVFSVIELDNIRRRTLHQDMIESEELDQDIISDPGDSDDESVADIDTRSVTDQSSPGELNIGMLIEDLSSEQLELRAEILDHFSSGCERVQLPTSSIVLNLKELFPM